MDYQADVKCLDRGRILAECGPMRLVIEAWIGKVTQRDSCIRAAKEAVALLERIARRQNILSVRYGHVPSDSDDPVIQKMIRSVVVVDRDLTPMACVAGTIADGVASFLRHRGMSKVIVNNGGDIAVRLGDGESIRVGIRQELSASRICSVLKLRDERSNWGIATSGLEGRSFTRGVASAATVVAGSASVADAAATAIANASFVEDPSVIQKPAEQLYEQTDIPGTLVTVQAGPFTEQKKDLALRGAVEKAEALINEGLIFGAYIAVDGKAAMTDFVRLNLEEAG